MPGLAARFTPSERPRPRSRLEIMDTQMATGDRLSLDMQDTSEVLSGTVYIPDTSASSRTRCPRPPADGRQHRRRPPPGARGARPAPDLAHQADGVRHAARQVTRKMLEYGAASSSTTASSRSSTTRRTRGAGADPAGGVLAWEPATGVEEPYSEDLGDNHILAGALRIAEVARSNGHPATT